MKKYLIAMLSKPILIFSFLFIANEAGAQSDKDKEIMVDSDSARAEFLRTDPDMEKIFANAYGYAMFPNVGKGAIGVGAASGNGIVYEQGIMVGSAKMSQVTVGFQVGGQAYRELIFFETKEALDKFKKNAVELTAQASAVAAKTGASLNAQYKDGIMIYTQQKGGLMYEASVGGQKFKYTPFEVK